MAGRYRRAQGAQLSAQPLSAVSGAASTGCPTAAACWCTGARRPRQGAAGDRHPGRPEPAGQPEQRRRAPAAHLPGSAEERGRRQAVRALRHGAAGAARPGRQGAPDRRARPVRRRPLAPGGKYLLTQRCTGRIPTSCRRPASRERVDVRDLAGKALHLVAQAAGRGPAAGERRRVGRRAQCQLARRRAGDAGVGRGAGRRRPGRGGRGPRPGLRHAAPFAASRRCWRRLGIALRRHPGAGATWRC